MFESSKYHHIDNGGLTFTVRADEYCNVTIEVAVSRYESAATFSFNLPELLQSNAALRQLEMMRDVINEAIQFVSTQEF